MTRRPAALHRLQLIRNRLSTAVNAHSQIESLRLQRGRRAYSVFGARTAIVSESPIRPNLR